MCSTEDKSTRCNIQTIHLINRGRKRRRGCKDKMEKEFQNSKKKKSHPYLDQKNSMNIEQNRCQKTHAEV